MSNTFEKYMAIAEAEIMESDEVRDTVARVAREFGVDETIVNFFLLETARKQGAGVDEAAMDFDLKDYSEFEKAWHSAIEWAIAEFPGSYKVPKSVIGAALADFAVDNAIDLSSISVSTDYDPEELSDYVQSAIARHKRGEASRA